MKVALLNDKLDAGGAEKVLVNMANMLHKKGVNVSIVLFLQPSVLDKLINPAIPVYYLHRKGRFDLWAMLSLKKIIKDFDIVHVHSRYNLRYYIVSRFITGISKPKIVFHEHVPVLSVSNFTKFCLRHAHAYVAVVQSMCKWAVENINLKLSEVFYLPNTINPPTSDIQQQNAGYKIVMTGNYWHFKNQLFAIDLLNALPEQYTLDIYGAVNNKNYYNQLLEKIEKNNLKSRIKLIEGVSNIYEVLERYNFAIHTSPHETGPLVLLEYMYAGLPFLTYNTGDVVTNIQSQLPEVVMNSFNIDEWKQAITDRMGNNNVRAGIRQKMKVIISEKYGEKNYWLALDRIYKAILN